jgi:hypothetical protein
MAADNDLSSDALSDIEEMKQGFSEAEVHLTVFVDLPDEAPYLLEIGEIGDKRIKTYDELNPAKQEPEMVNPKSELYEKHPDRVISQPHRERTLQRNQLIPDLSN